MRNAKATPQVEAMAAKIQLGQGLSQATATQVSDTVDDLAIERTWYFFFIAHFSQIVFEKLPNGQSGKVKGVKEKKAGCQLFVYFRVTGRGLNT